MPSPLSEFFNGGIVTARHPALLKPGELQRADDCVYREKDPAIWRAPGRSHYGTVVADSPVLGLAALPFENALPSKVLAFAGTTLYILPLDITAAESTPQTSLELGGPGLIEAGVVAIVSTHSEFTAAGGAKPFLPTCVGSRVRSDTTASGNVTADSNIVVAGVKGTPTNGRYPTVVLKQINGDSVSTIFIAGTYDIIFEWGISQTFQLAANSRDNILDSVQYGGSYFAWTAGQAPVRVGWTSPPSLLGVTTLVDSSTYGKFISMRGMGLDPVIQAPTLSLLTGNIPGTSTAYAWPQSLKAGYFWFLITEIYVPPAADTDTQGSDAEARELESAYLAPDSKFRKGIPIPILLVDLARGVRITLPAPVNTGGGGRLSTHWGIYMAPQSTADATDIPSLATFRRIARPAINSVRSGQTYDLYENLTSESSFVTATAGGEGQSDFESPSRMIGPFDDAWVSGNPTKSGIAKTPGTDPPGVDNAVTELQFGTLGSGGLATQTVTGIGVAIHIRASSTDNAAQKSDYYMYLKNAAKRSSTNIRTVENNQFQLHTFGGPGDTHGVSWGLGSTMSTFRVVVGIVKSTGFHRINLDAASVTVYYSTNSLNLNGKAYRVVTYRDQIGTAVSEPAAGVVPTCSTGDFFNGMLVVNNVNDETAIRYSLPGKPEFFPSPYVMRFNSTKRKDKVTCIRSLGQILVVGMENSIKRVNYLPREINTDLNDGLAQEDLTVDHGIAGPLAAAKFDFGGGGTVLAYASAAGMFITNGINTRPLNLDLDWPNTVKLSALNSATLRVYPREKWLVFDYCPAGALHDRNTRRLIFSYAMDKIKDGGYLPATGPITVSGRSSCEVFANGTSYIFTGHETDGKIYREDHGVTQASGYEVHDSSDTLVSAPIQPLIRTRKMLPAGIERDAREERIYILFASYGTILEDFPATTVKGSTTLTKSGVTAFSSAYVGRRVIGPGIEPGTIIIAFQSSSAVTLSQPANASGTGLYDIDNGTILITVRGSSIGEAVASLDSSYGSTVTGDLIVVHNDNSKQGLELQIEKVVLPNGTSVDLGVNMRLHQFTLLLNDQGTEQNRSLA